MRSGVEGTLSYVVNLKPEYLREREGEGKMKESRKAG